MILIATGTHTEQPLKDWKGIRRLWNDGKNQDHPNFRIVGIVEEGNFVFWFGAQINSTLNFTQSGWLILFNPELLSGQQKLGKLSNTVSLAEQRRPVQTSHWRFFNSCSSSMDTWGNLSNLWIPCVYFLLDQGIPVEYELDTFNTPHTGTTLCPPKIGYVNAMPNPAPGT